ncbi:hypothetical protein [Piscinibacter terrae]|uniref:hypothetical protein n=1 Tax=Piscinibacter terrae TaxID=2496871 RepID=UPI001F1FCA1A|nr:hypothetical protein [Albitalea terrae]
MLRPAILAVSLATALLAGCDMLGIESPEKVAAARDAEGRAIGGACRHAGRAIEDCYALNRRADKAAIFAGWRDMNDYMRENKIEPVTPVIVQQQPTTKVVADSKSDKSDKDAKDKDADAEKPAKPKLKEAKEAKESKDAKPSHAS